MIDLTHEDFKRHVIEKKATCCVMVRADWSGECFLMESMLRPLESEFSGVEFATIDIEVQQEIARDYGITDLPFLLFFSKGNLLECRIGLQSKDKLRRSLQNLI